MDCLKLTTYFGERGRAGTHFLTDAIMDIYARNDLQRSLVVRGIEGFGAKHHLRTDRLLSLSEDLPLVSVAIDRRERIETALADVRQLEFDGLLTLERAQLLTKSEDFALTPASRVRGEATKLTVYVGRQERAAGQPAYKSVTELLHRRGAGAATALLGVDGIAHGIRRRATFFGRNAGVPMMIVAIADAETIASALAELGGLLDRPLVTVERVTLCKLGGQRLADLPEPTTDDGVVQHKLTVHAGAQARHDGQPLHDELVRALRRAGSAGATSLRAIWGFDTGERPHGDAFCQLRRRVPVVTVVIDTPVRVRAWFEIVDAMTDEAGLVTCEPVRVIA